jgi:hypothetical protein
MWIISIPMRTRLLENEANTEDSRDRNVEPDTHSPNSKSLVSMSIGYVAYGMGSTYFLHGKVNQFVL